MKPLPSSLSPRAPVPDRESLAWQAYTLAFEAWCGGTGTIAAVTEARERWDALQVRRFAP